MKIERWMQHPVLTLKPLDSALHARELMEQHRVNQLPVVAGGRLVGIVTDRDIRDAFPSVFEQGARRPRRNDGTDPAAIAIEDVMTRNVLTLTPDVSVAAAARLMSRERVGAIPIVQGGRLVGILARSDILEAYVALAEPCADGSRPSRGSAAVSQADRTPCAVIRVALVDDNTSFRRGLAELLRHDGHEVRDYGAPAEVSSFDAFADRQLVITDYEMRGGVNGLAFADAVHAAHPDIPVVLLTANSSTVLADEVAVRDFLHEVEKPLDYEQLHEVVHRLARRTVVEPPRRAASRASR